MNKEFLTDEYRKKIQEYIKRENNISYISYDDICNFLVDMGKIDKVEAAEVFSIISGLKPTTFAHLPNCIWIKSTDDLLLFCESLYDEIKDNIAKAFVQISKEKNKNQEILEQKEFEKRKEELPPVEAINKEEKETTLTIKPKDAHFLNKYKNIEECKELFEFASKRCDFNDKIKDTLFYLTTGYHSLDALYPIVWKGSNKDLKKFINDYCLSEEEKKIKNYHKWKIAVKYFMHEDGKFFTEKQLKANPNKKNKK